MRRWPVGHLRVDVHDASPAPFTHPRQDRSAQQHRALDEELELVEVVAPGGLGECDVGLGPVALTTSTAIWPRTDAMADTRPSAAPRR